MDRRTLLAALGAVSVAGLAGCAPSGESPGETAAAAGVSTAPASPVASPASPTPSPTAAGPHFTAPTGLTPVPLSGTVNKLPIDGPFTALTLDDGTNVEVISAYLELAQTTGIRLTFFINGVNPSWTTVAPQLRPLVDSGQIVLGNHTWSHPYLTKLSSAQLTEEIRKNERFLFDTYGVTGQPFLRPPFGAHSARVDAQLADLGYPGVIKWYGSLADSGVLPPATIVANAEQWFAPGRIVIGHLNHAPVIEVMGRIAEIIAERGLTPVTMADVFQAGD